MEKLKFFLNSKGWDGRWFRRAFFPDGKPIGSMECVECKIDAIAQAWSVISGAGDEDKIKEAMDSVHNNLVDRENMLIKLLTPPFNESEVEPGYIKSYLPGVRENGGQYTHGAIWVMIASAILGENERSTEYLRMINPIEHARTKEDVFRYKVEPYVIAADIYSHYNLLGRGGWTWYTGSASWFYIAGIRYMLGFYKNGNVVSINPVIPNSWEGFELSYSFGKSFYDICVYNKLLTEGSVTGLYLDNSLMDSNEFLLVDDGKVHKVEIWI